MWIIRVVGTGPILIAFVTCGSRLGARSTPCQPEAVVFDSIHPCYKNIDIQHGTAVAAAVGVGVDEGECQVILNVGFEDIAHGWCDVSTQSRELGWEKSGWQ